MKKFNLTEYLKNPSQKVVTRDGRAVRIICIDRKYIVSLENFKTKPLPIVALVFEKNIKSEGLFCYYEDGRISVNQNTSHDLFFAPIKREGWVNLYKDKSGVYTSNLIFETEKRAKEVIGKKHTTYLTTIKIEWEE